MSTDDIAGIVERLAALDAERAELVRQRNEWIVAAHESGASLRQIAEAIGLSHMAVRKIVAG